MLCWRIKYDDDDDDIKRTTVVQRIHGCYGLVYARHENVRILASSSIEGKVGGFNTCSG